jgi:hypothetical protein
MPELDRKKELIKLHKDTFDIAAKELSPFHKLSRSILNKRHCSGRVTMLAVATHYRNNSPINNNRIRLDECPVSDDIKVYFDGIVIYKGTKEYLMNWSKINYRCYMARLKLKELGVNVYMP